MLDVHAAWLTRSLGIVHTDVALIPDTRHDPQWGSIIAPWELSREMIS